MHGICFIQIVDNLKSYYISQDTFFVLLPSIFTVKVLDLQLIHPFTKVHKVQSLLPHIGFDFDIIEYFFTALSINQFICLAHHFYEVFKGDSAHVALVEVLEREFEFVF